MDLPIVQPVTPFPVATRVAGQGQPADGFADLIEALLEDPVQGADLAATGDGGDRPLQEDERDTAPMVVVPAMAMPSFVEPVVTAPAVPDAVETAGVDAPTVRVPAVLHTGLDPQAGPPFDGPADARGEEWPDEPPVRPAPFGPIAAAIPEARSGAPVPTAHPDPIETPMEAAPTVARAAGEAPRAEGVGQAEPDPAVGGEESLPPEPIAASARAVAADPGAPPEAARIEGPAPVEASRVIDRVEEWLERTGGAEPTTISIELPDPEGELVIRVAMRDGHVDLEVIRPGGEPPAWLIDRMEEALARHGFELAGDRRREPHREREEGRPAPAVGQRRTRQRTGIWM